MAPLPGPIQRCGVRRAGASVLGANPVSNEPPKGVARQYKRAYRGDTRAKAKSASDALEIFIKVSWAGERPSGSFPTLPQTSLDPIPRSRATSAGADSLFHPRGRGTRNWSQRPGMVQRLHNGLVATHYTSSNCQGPLGRVSHLLRHHVCSPSCCGPTCSCLWLPICSHALATPDLCMLERSYLHSNDLVTAQILC